MEEEAKALVSAVDGGKEVRRASGHREASAKDGQMLAGKKDFPATSKALFIFAYKRPAKLEQFSFSKRGGGTISALQFIMPDFLYIYYKCMCLNQACIL